MEHADYATLAIPSASSLGQSASVSTTFTSTRATCNKFKKPQVSGSASSSISQSPARSYPRRRNAKEKHALNHTTTGIRMSSSRKHTTQMRLNSSTGPKEQSRKPPRKSQGKKQRKDIKRQPLKDKSTNARSQNSEDIQVAETEQISSPSNGREQFDCGPKHPNRSAKTSSKSAFHRFGLTCREKAVQEEEEETKSKPGPKDLHSVDVIRKLRNSIQTLLQKEALAGEKKEQVPNNDSSHVRKPLADSYEQFFTSESSTGDEDGNAKMEDRQIPEESQEKNDDGESDNNEEASVVSPSVPHTTLPSKLQKETIQNPLSRTCFGWLASSQPAENDEEYTEETAFHTVGEMSESFGKSAKDNNLNRSRSQSLQMYDRSYPSSANCLKSQSRFPVQRHSISSTNGRHQSRPMKFQCTERHLRLLAVQQSNWSPGSSVDLSKISKARTAPRRFAGQDETSNSINDSDSSDNSIEYFVPSDVRKHFTDYDESKHSHGDLDPNFRDNCGVSNECTESAHCNELAASKSVNSDTRELVLSSITDATDDNSPYPVPQSRGDDEPGNNFPVPLSAGLAFSSSVSRDSIRNEVADWQMRQTVQNPMKRWNASTTVDSSVVSECIESGITTGSEHSAKSLRISKTPIVYVSPECMPDDNDGDYSFHEVPEGTLSQTNTTLVRSTLTKPKVSCGPDDSTKSVHKDGPRLTQSVFSLRTSKEGSVRINVSDCISSGSSADDNTRSVPKDESYVTQSIHASRTPLKGFKIMNVSDCMSISSGSSAEDGPKRGQPLDTPKYGQQIRSAEERKGEDGIESVRELAKDERYSEEKLQNAAKVIVDKEDDDTSEESSNKESEVEADSTGYSSALGRSAAFMAAMNVRVPPRRLKFYCGDTQKAAFEHNNGKLDENPNFSSDEEDSRKFRVLFSSKWSSTGANEKYNSGCPLLNANTGETPEAARKCAYYAGPTNHASSIEPKAHSSLTDPNKDATYTEQTKRNVYDVGTLDTDSHTNMTGFRSYSVPRCEDDDEIGTYASLLNDHGVAKAVGRDILTKPGVRGFLYSSNITVPHTCENQFDKIIEETRDFQAKSRSSKKYVHSEKKAASKKCRRIKKKGD